MLTFGHPAILLLLLLVPIFIALGIRSDRISRRAMQNRGSASQQRPVRRWLLLTALSLALLALSNPVIQGKTAPTRRADADVVFVLDISRSMLTSDVPSNRLTLAEQTIEWIATHLEGPRLALVTFAGTPEVQCALTLDNTAFEQILRRASSDPPARGGTSIGAAVRFAAESVFADVSTRPKTLVLLSDGGELSDPGNSDWEKAVRERHIRIIAIGTGNEAEGGIVPLAFDDLQPFLYRGQPVRTRLEPRLLREMASATGGSYWNAQTSNRRAITQAVAASSSNTVAEVLFDFRSLLLAISIGLLLAEMLLPRAHRTTAGVLLLLLLLRPPIFGQDYRPPPDEPAWSLAAKAYESYRKGQYLSAATSYDAALRISPQDAEILFNAGCARYKVSNYLGAYEGFKASAKVATDPTLKARAMMGAGNSMYRQANASSTPADIFSRLRAALHWYREALDVDPGQLDAAYNIQVILRRLNEMRLQQSAEPPPGLAGTPLSNEPGDVARQGRVIAPRKSRTMANRDPVEKDW